MKLLTVEEQIQQLLWFDYIRAVAEFVERHKLVLTDEAQNSVRTQKLLTFVQSLTQSLTGKSVPSLAQSRKVHGAGKSMPS